MGTLYIISTPIGNLQDITFRALETLRTVDRIFCEDTRVSQKLLKYYKITTPLQSFHQHTTPQKITKIVEQLASGQNFGLICDAGTPGIADPGQPLVQAAVQQGITVVPIPGACAIITALQAAGVDTSHFEFVGFIPHKKGRQTLLNSIGTAKHTIIAYESPYRLLKTLQHLQTFPRSIIVARELTKLHEEYIRGTCQAVYTQLSQRLHIKGEIVLVIHSVKGSITDPPVDTAELR